MGALPRLGVAVLVGAAVVAGRWWGMRDLHTIMAMPQGGLYLSHATNTVFHKLAGSQVSWVRIPDPYQAQLVKLFSPDPTTTTTTTTVPQGGDKR